MKIFLMYSYKGGTGRTVNTANIAAFLAKKKKVLCLDLDIGGPGLHVLFNKKPEPALQDYLLKPEKFALSNALIDVRKGKEEILGLDGDLKFIGASTDYNKQVITDLHFEKLSDSLWELLDKVAEFYKPDIVFLDSASGYNEVTKAGINLADHIMFFFRFSRQHIRGTYSMGKFFRYCDIDFSLISSAVSSHMTEVKKTTYSKYLDNQLLKEEEYGQGTSIIKGYIPEHEELKWDEHILLFDEKFRKCWEKNKNISDWENELDGDDKDNFEIMMQYEKISTHIINIASS